MYHFQQCFACVCHCSAQANIDLYGGSYLTHTNYDDNHTLKLLTTAASVTGNANVQLEIRHHP